MIKDIKVLVVEDNLMNQEIVKAFLNKRKLNNLLVGSGKEALELLENNSFDLILMDIQMPDLDGIEVTRIIRSKGIKTPIVAMTAYAMEEDKEECLKAGMNYYISKPIMLKSFLEIIDSILGAYY